MLAMAVDIARKIGFPEGLARRSGATAWKSKMGPMVLTLTCVRKLSGVVLRIVLPDWLIPAFAMTMSRDVMECFDWSSAIAVVGSVSEEASSLMRMSLELGPLGREVRVGVERKMSRTAAMMVVLGRWRRVDVRPRPMPRFAPVIRYVRGEDMVGRLGDVVAFKMKIDWVEKMSRDLMENAS